MVLAEHKPTNRLWDLDERKLSILVFSLFFSWMLAFTFEGQVFYALAASFQVDPSTFVFGSIAVHMVGLFSGGFFIKTMKSAKHLMLASILICIAGSSVFFFTPSVIWTIALLVCSFLAGTCVATWGFYFRSGTPSADRIKTAADGLIFSNVLMILLNTAAIHLSPFIGLGFSLIMLVAAFLFALRLPETSAWAPASAKRETASPPSIVKPLAFLCLFITIITINSGLMYQVVNPAFAPLGWLVSWYWAVPYIAALYIMRQLPRTTNRSYILYVAIAMIGFSFIAFMLVDRSEGSYLLVNTLMLGAFGIYDLFWWSILGEMLDLNANPAKVLGIGLSANVLGVLLGGLIGNTITTSTTQSTNTTLIALGVVLVILMILPLLHKQLSLVLQNHTFLTAFSGLSPMEKTKAARQIVLIGQLTERESEIVDLLLRGRTYKMIADELYLSENTVKTHIKNLYSKLNIQSRPELIHLMIDRERTKST